MTPLLLLPLQSLDHLIQLTEQPPRTTGALFLLLRRIAKKKEIVKLQICKILLITCYQTCQNIKI